MRVVADVGGTNSRLAISQAGMVLSGTTRSFANTEWASLEDIIKAYLASQNGAAPTEMVIAVAGPVQGDRAVLTNRNWVVEAGELADQFGFAKVHLFNDLTALGFAVPHLDKDQLQQISQGADQAKPASQSLVIGIGTGFNVSPVLQSGGVVMCPAVEAGHVSMPLGVVRPLQALDLDADRYPTVEDLFSGRGFADFCQQITGDMSLGGHAAMAAYARSDAAATTLAIDEYAALLGHLVRDLSLAYLPSSGIYFAGSVVRSVLGRAPTKFIEIQQAPCRIMGITALPVYVIDDDAAALTGCAGFSFS